MGRKKKKPGEIIETVGAGVTAQDVVDIDLIAGDLEWTRSKLSGKLLRLGLAVYKRTGSFEDIEVVENKAVTENLPDIIELPEIISRK